MPVASPPFDADVYAARRRHLMDQLQSGLVLLLGNEPSAFNYAANHYPFRQDSTFLYFLGLDHPGLDAVIDVEEGKTTLFGEDPDLDTVVWDGPQPSVDERAAQAGVENEASPSALADTVRRAHESGRDVRRSEGLR